ncbi:rubrerythrin [Candidatus Vecturithrix granuli]|uniref:Rubrerythrin n=1 Tax=Vecturithrix granuli TaxID=1499967 RepID=A0A081C9B6_VECG1|nr:rubrerythrin [Candidatus Vecturithrix granuli]
MKQFRSVDDILDFAISEEEAAAEFYRQLASTVSTPVMQQVFEEFAMEEVVHKQKLLLVKEQRLLLPAEDTIVELWKGEIVVDSVSENALEYQQALQLAIDKEKAAFKMYHDLAGVADDAALKSLFMTLAEEEAKHKVRFEVEYDKQFLTDN